MAHRHRRIAGIATTPEPDDDGREYQVPLHIWVAPDLKDALADWADAEGYTRSGLCKLLLRRAVEGRTTRADP